ncbi:hypothetical protein D3C73_1600680 [compost metagenome]
MMQVMTVEHPIPRVIRLKGDNVLLTRKEIKRILHNRGAFQRFTVFAEHLEEVAVQMHRMLVCY